MARLKRINKPHSNYAIGCCKNKFSQIAVTYVYFGECIAQDCRIQTKSGMNGTRRAYIHRHIFLCYIFPYQFTIEGNVIQSLALLPVTLSRVSLMVVLLSELKTDTYNLESSISHTILNVFDPHRVCVTEITIFL